MNKDKTLDENIDKYEEVITLIHCELLKYFDADEILLNYLDRARSETFRKILEKISDIIQDELVEKGYWSG